MASTISSIDWARRITTSRSDRPSSIAARLIGVTRIRSITPLRTSAMIANPTNAVPNIAIWMSRPGTNQLNAFVVGAGRLRRALEERPEEEQVEQRQHHPEEDPGRLPDGQPERPMEDEPGVAKGLHERVPCFDRDGAVVDGDGRAHAAASSRSERPVWRRKTSSRLGRCERDASALAGRRRRGHGAAAGRPLALLDVQPDEAVVVELASRTNAWPRTSARTRSRGAIDADRHDVAGDLRA